jgi:hypothetical protein
MGVVVHNNHTDNSNNDNILATTVTVIIINVMSSSHIADSKSPVTFVTGDLQSHRIENNIQKGELL